MPHAFHVKLIWQARAKTDPIDARKLAELLRVNLFPAIWIPDVATRRRRQLLRGRAFLMQQRTRLKTPGSGSGGRDRRRGLDEEGAVAFPRCSLYGECMARLISTTIRLDEEDVRALKRARAAGLSASELIRKGLRVVASRYYTGRRPPSTRLFESTDTKLGDESELFRNLED